MRWRLRRCGRGEILPCRRQPTILYTQGVGEARPISERNIAVRRGFEVVQAHCVNYTVSWIAAAGVISIPARNESKASSSESTRVFPLMRC